MKFLNNEHEHCKMKKAAGLIYRKAKKLAPNEKT